jgi:hypothetical protein
MTQPTWKHEDVFIDNVDKQVYKIISRDLIDYLKLKLCIYWEQTGMDGELLFPGPQPVSIERKNFSYLQHTKYVACPKLDGERYFLFCTTAPHTFEKGTTAEDIKICLLVNRRFEFFIVTQQFNAHEVYRQGTLLDGELLRNEFIIHDVISVIGNVVKEKDWFTRWNSGNVFCQENYIYQENSSFGIRLKKFYHMSQLGMLFKDVQDEKIEADGIVLYPMDEGIGYRTQYTLYKWKPPGKHTIDFKIEINGNTVDLVVFDRGDDKVFATITRDVALSLGPVKSGSILEFEYKNNEFSPVKIRNDKPIGNNYKTARKTMTNIRENITQKEMCESVWK